MSRSSRSVIALVIVAAWSGCRGRSHVGSAPSPRTSKAIWSFAVAQPGASTEAPIRLTATDGTGLELTSLEAAVAIRGPLAFTELTLAFANPLDRTLEGRFEVVLPAGAAVSRFAMQLPPPIDAWQEAEVVEKQAARVAYEDALHRRQDPALLEKAAGNAFGARVFPIPRRGTKRIKIAWSQELPPPDEPYRLPLAGLPLLPALRIVVDAELELVQVARERFRPGGDFVLERPGVSRGLRAGRLAVGRLRASLPTAPAAIDAATILVDTSASRAVGFGREVDAVGALVDELARVHGGALPIVVAAFDQAVAPIYEGAASGFDRAARARLVERGALGATDLAGALAWAAADAGKRADAKHRRLLLVTDGVATAAVAPAGTNAGDEGEAAQTKRALASLRPRFERMDAVLVGGIRDESATRSLVTGALAADGAVLDGDESAPRIVRRLDETTRSGVRVAVEGATWSWPERLDGLQAGDDVMVYAEYPDPGARAAMGVTLAGPIDYRAEVPLAGERADAGPLVERAWARARIASLAAEEARATDGKRAVALHRQAVELSTRYRVLGDATALLVLETDADYARFGIDRKALADVLTVDARGVHLEHRASAVVAAPAPPVVETLATRFRKSAVHEQPDRFAQVALPAASPTPFASGLTDRIEASPTGASLQVGPSPQGIGGLRATGSATIARDTDDLPADPPAPLAEAFVDGRLAERRAPSPSPPPPMPVPPAERSVRIGHGSRVMELVGGDAVGESFGAGGIGLIGGSGPTPPPDTGAPAYTGRMAEVMRLVDGRKLDRALAAARAWRAAEPGDVLALVALGDVLRARKAPAEAARAYGSIVDLFPSRADLRRFAGDLLESLGADGEPLAADSFARALADRPDHPNSHRLRAFALLREGRFADAFAAIEAGAARRYPEGRFLGVDRILREDAGLIAAAWLRREPKQRTAVEKRLAALGARLPAGPSLRFVLSWETDANDVDFHILDRAGNRAWYASKHLASGGDLYADVTTGYGPECFTIEGRPGAFPYRLLAHYYARGPMGYGMGKLEIVESDGDGRLRFDERPFVVMSDQAYVPLGTLAAPL